MFGVRGAVLSPVNESDNMMLSSYESVGKSIGEEEFLMESDTSRRFLGYDGKTISYKGLGKPAVCNEKIAGNCLKAYGKQNRPCTYYNRCKHEL
ncbi:hypothetical protein Tsubulata_038058 [Turnera subulata]|uniref:Uncharacterized protein n=1 Tax=Turnera subulata TaxID=218843 RepID=A0A9Q0JP90_9ROSI|nr:hypothetical protein Tsubulata_038058 [Turnera subulata]